MSQKKRVQLVADNPASDDAFGSHKKVAEAIGSLVLSEPGGKTVAIEGSWGSGKSTVVNLLQRQIASRDSVCVSIFDAWAHQGDPLRRAFLETLISVLNEKKWIVDEQKWQVKAAELAKRRKTTNRTTSPSITHFGKAMGIALSLFPLGIPLVTLAKDYEPAAAIGIVFLLLPLTILLLNLAFRRGNDIWALFIQKSIIEEKTETIETPDPTSIEFKGIFDELMKDCLDNQGRTLIIVVDNLDRIPASDAKSIWAVLRVFLDRSGRTIPAWQTRIWTVIPYDPAGIHAQIGGQANADETGLTASNFLDKAVQIRFHVSPPVLSNWHDYLLSCLEKAFPEHEPSNQAFHTIYRLYATTSGAGGATPTPRDLITYVNEIGALYRQWGDQIPLAHMAYYVLARATSPNIATGLLNQTLPTTSALALLPATVRDDLAALHFNVEPNLARQVLLRGPIVEALAAREPEKLKKLAEGYPGFIEALELELPKLVPDWTSSETQSFARATNCIVSSAVLESAPQGARHGIVETIENGFRSLKTWKQFNDETADGIVAFLALSRNQEIAKAIVDSIRASGSTVKDLPTKDVSAWARGLVKAAKAIAPVVPLPAETPFYAPGTAEEWPGICEVLFDADPQGQSWPWIRPVPEWQVVANALNTSVNADQFTTRHLKALKVGVASKHKLAYEQLANSIEARLVANVGVDAERIIALSSALVTIEESTDQKRGRLTRLAQQGHLINYFFHAWNANSDEAIALLLALHIREFPNASVPNHAHNSPTGQGHLNSLLANHNVKPKVAGLFVEALVSIGALQIILQMIDASINPIWVRACLDELQKRNISQSVFTREALTKRWQFIRTHLDGGKKDGGVLDSLVKALCSDAAIVDAILKEPFDPEMAWLYGSLVRSDVADLKVLSHWCEAGLLKLDKERWTKDFASQSDVIQLVLDLASKGAAPSLEVAYLDCLADLSHALATGDSARAALLVTNWALLKQSIQGHRIEKFKQTALIHAENTDGKVSEVFFDVLGSDIADEKLLSEDRRVVSELFSKLVDAKNTRGLSWLAKAFSDHGDFLKEYKPDYDVKDFKERIRTALSTSTDQPYQESIRRIADALSVTV